MLQNFKNFIVEHYRFTTSVGKYPGIDFLRFLAVMSVALFHYKLFGFNFGFLGVDLFFTISGFLIGGMILDELTQNETFSFKKFYRNRFLRIYPTYLFFVILCIGMKVGFGNVFQDLYLGVRSLFTVLTLSQTTLPYYLYEYGFTIDQRFVPGGTWSLVIEEHFYILAPLVLYISWKIGRWQAVTIVTALVFLSGIFVRLHMTANFIPNDPNWHYASYIQFHSRFDQLAAGVLSAIIVRRHKVCSELLFVIGGLISIWIVLYLYSNSQLWAAPNLLTRETIYFPTLLGIAFSCFVISLCNLRVKSTFITFVGRLSYPMYLGHIFFLEMNFIGHIFSNQIVFGAVEPLALLSVICSLFCAYLISLFIEYPFIRFYKKLRT